jgi:hypothetical protein
MPRVPRGEKSLADVSANATAIPSDVVGSGGADVVLDPVRHFYSVDASVFNTSAADRQAVPGASW